MLVGNESVVEVGHKEAGQLLKLSPIAYWEKSMWCTAKGMQLSHMGELITISSLEFDGYLLSRINILGRDNERLEVICLQFKTKHENQKSYEGASKKVFISCSGKAEKTEKQFQDSNIIVAEN